MHVPRLASFCVVLFCLSAIPAFAQTHPCDLAPPTAGTFQAGSATVLKLCEPLNDPNGNPITSFKVYDNGTPVTVPMVHGSTPNAAGMYEYASPYTVPATGGAHALEVAALSDTKESAKSPPFALTVSLPTVAPAAPSKVHLSPAP